MPKLGFKRKNNSDPKGKPRVYFCCHPNDFNKYFHTIANEIFKNYNCVFYVDTEPMGEMNYQEWCFSLDTMRLFIVPVTRNLLTTENRALNFEIKYAQKKHIPILPLMQESGLDELFAQKIGNIQYLNKFQQDETAIDYEEKLKKYLDSVFVGDEIIEKIKQSFDAYIFLSYRKKDRAYAQELMSLIHDTEYCRDIAIWYDEFLVPGENFNDSIKEALEKSDLFTLAVTPNLINEENYVKNVEYPMAMYTGKRIFPVEMAPTDVDELKSGYIGIPDCVSAYDKEVFRNRLLESLEGIMKKENDSDADHNYLIGLAYLLGIDVEVDRKRAVELISFAAKTGSNEAIKKLVFMYTNGEGVETDYEKALFWQLESLMYCWDKMADKHTEDNAYELSNAYKTLGDIRFCLGSDDDACHAYKQAISACEDAFDEFGFDFENLRTFYIKTCLSLADFLMKQKKDFFEAEEYYDNVISFGSEFLEKLSDEEKFLILDCVVRKAEFLYAAGNMSEAEDKLKTILEFFNLKENKKTHQRNTVALIYKILGRIEEEKENLPEALNFYTLSIRTCKEILSETNDVLVGEILYNCYDLAAKIALKEGRKDKAIKCLEASLESRKRVCDYRCDYHTESDLAYGYRQLGYVYESLKNLSQAEDMYLCELRIREQVSEKYSVNGESDLIEAQCRLLKVYLSKNDLSSASKILMDAASEVEKYGLDNISAKAVCAIGSSYIDVSAYYAEQNKLQYSEWWLKQVNELYEECMDLDIAEEDYSVLASGFEYYGDKLAEIGKNTEAEKWYAFSLRYLYDRIKKEQRATDYESSANIWCKLALLKPDNLEEYGTKAYEIWEYLQEIYPENENYKKFKDGLREALW